MSESGVTFIRGRQEVSLWGFELGSPRLFVLRNSISLDEKAQNGSELMPKRIYGSTPQLRFKSLSVAPDPLLYAAGWRDT
jgi:hypothetical protein